MKQHIIPILVILLTASIAALFLRDWIRSGPRLCIEKRVPGMDGAPPEALTHSQTTPMNIKGVLTTFGHSASNTPGNWPFFRGPHSDNICRDTTPLTDQWPPQGPRILWSIPLGEGHAGPAIKNGRVYVLDYDEKNKGDALRCFSLADGREIWRRLYEVNIKRNHGMSRTIPAVTDRYVVSIGPKCHVLCVDAPTGAFRWGIDLVHEYGTDVPLWYTGQCPIIDGSTAIIAPGGRALLLGVDCETGDILWKTPNPDGWKMSHASVIPFTLNKKKMYIYPAIGGVVGVSAEGSDAGQILWQTTDWNNAVTAPSAVPLGDGRVFLTAGYGRGSMMLTISQKEDTWTADVLYRLNKTVFACEQQTPLFYRGLLFGILPKDAGGLKNQFVCLHPNGTPMWTSGKANRFGLGPFILADNKIFILNDNGVLTMIRADSKAYHQLAQAKLLGGRDAWGPMALAEGRLLLRDWKKMICIDVSQQGVP